jgi:ubiquinone/menaquinone biosynthesis C-methylase UbiE
MDLLSRIIRTSDKKISMIGGMHLPPEWWSRKFEYAYCIDFASPAQTVADMGCGWMFRPFKDALADICGFVYAVDADKRLLQQNEKENMIFVVAPMEDTGLPAASCDRVFCVSVLEDLQDPAPALLEFARVLKDDGLIVITMDVPYDVNKSCPRYPGQNIGVFNKAIKAAGLQYAGDTDYIRPHDALKHEEWNLCVFRCVLKKQ